MILSADMIVFSSLALSCFVAELNQTVIDMHRTDWMMIVQKMTSSFSGKLNFLSCCRKYNFCQAFFQTETICEDHFRLRGSTSCLYADTSYFWIRPMTVVSLTNYRSFTYGSSEVHSFVQREKSSGERTHPWMRLVLMVWLSTDRRKLSELPVQCPSGGLTQVFQRTSRPQMLARQACSHLILWWTFLAPGFFLGLF